MGVYSSTVANAYADQIKAVYEYLNEVRKVADRLTPVEDITSFQAQIEELYSRLDLLVEASTLIVTATPVGELILTGSIPSIRTLLGIEDVPDDIVTQAELDAAIAAAGAGFGNGLGGLQNSINTINLLITELDQYRVIQQSTIEGLQISYQNVAAGLETNQLNTAAALQRLTVQEQFATLLDQRYDNLSQELGSTILGVQAANDIIAGHSASISSALDSIQLNTLSIDALSSTLNDIQTGQAATATAISQMGTTIEGLGDDLIAQSNQTTALKSAIGGSANLLANADFVIDASGWNIVVAEEDWANSVLTVNTFNMPEDVNCLEVLGAPSPLGDVVIESPLVLLEANNHYIVSGYPCVDNGAVELSYKAFNNAGAVVSQGACPPTFNVTNNTNFASYTRTWVKFQAPTGAVKLRVYLKVTGDGDWVTQGALFRPMVEKAWAEQTAPSAWTPNVGGATTLLSEAVQSLYTDVESINGALTSQAGQITALEASIATLPTVYLQPDMPTGGSYNVGDIWFETDNGNLQYIWNGTIWSTSGTIAGAVNYAQPDMPTGGSYNVGDQWIDTDNNNRLHRWNGTTWVDVSDPRITAQGDAIQSLTTRVSSVEGINSSQAQSITDLQSAVADPLTGLASRASAGALSDLATRTTAAEDNIEAQSNLIFNLNAGLQNAQQGISALGTGVQSLTVRVTEIDNTLDLVSQSLITRLDQIQSDSILTPEEKPQVILDYQAIIDERPGILAQADVYGITTEKATYDAAVNALTAYLATLTTPTMWNDVSGYTNLT